MAKNKKSKRSDYITYLFSRGFLFFLRALPLKLSRGLCVNLGRMAYRLDKKHRELTINNLSLAFPEKNEEEILDISKKVFENLGATLFDFARIPTINERNYKDHFEYEGAEYVEDAMAKGKGILFVSGHLCCWEQMSALTYPHGKVYVLAKDLHNRYTNDYIKDVRLLNDVHVIPIRDSVKEVIKLLKGGNKITALLDQNTHRHEAEFVDFFGRPAATQYFAALLALKLDISVIPMFLKRRGDFRYTLYYMKPFEIIRTGDRKKDMHDNTQAFTSLIEDEIRKRPEDWLWVHNRWKQT